MFKDYLAELTEKGFIQSVEGKKGRKTYSLTDKGFNFLERYKVILEFVENFGL